MSDAIVYIDMAEVREGALDELKAALEELVAFVDANEPRIIAYNAYLSDGGTRLTVVHVHPDSASLEHHMEVAGPIFRRFVELVTLSSIQVYGEASELSWPSSTRRRASWVAAPWRCTPCMRASLVSMLVDEPASQLGARIPLPMSL